MILPMKKNAPSRVDPAMMIIFSLPKAGKTELAAGLENNLIIDMEDGSDFYESMSVKAKTMSELEEVLTAIDDAGRPYKYLTLDTATVLQDIVKPLANKLYRATPMGKNFDSSKDVLTLAQGAGYQYHRMAFEKVINLFKERCDTLILLAHVKDKYIEKAPGEEVVASELDLIGKLKSIMSARSDAMGYMYRKGDQNILSFKTSESLVAGARSKHLKNKEIVISEMTEDGLITHWDEIFKD